jgi:hypothetical protein
MFASALRDISRNVRRAAATVKYNQNTGARDLKNIQFRGPQL